MQRLFALAICMTFVSLAAAAETPALFHMSVKDVPVENGKMLDMAFHEIAREPDSSTVHVVRRSGGSVSSSMFIVRGMCGVARSRGERFFQSERIEGEAERYLVTFPKTEPSPGTAFTMTQCDLMGY